jgi:hypothetical protein
MKTQKYWMYSVRGKNYGERSRKMKAEKPIELISAVNSATACINEMPAIITTHIESMTCANLT